MKLVLEYHNTPMVWRAHDEDTADGAPDAGELARMHGEGSSREAALVDLLEKLEGYYASRLSKGANPWVPVSERLPHPADRVAVYSATDDMADIGLVEAEDGPWHCEASVMDVTHWMPLPEAPK